MARIIVNDGRVANHVVNGCRIELEQVPQADSESVNLDLHERAIAKRVLSKGLVAFLLGNVCRVLAEKLHESSHSLRSSLIPLI